MCAHAYRCEYDIYRNIPICASTGLSQPRASQTMHSSKLRNADQPQLINNCSHFGLGVLQATETQHLELDVFPKDVAMAAVQTELGSLRCA